MTTTAMAALLALSGCSEDEPTAEASPSGLARYTAAPDPATPTQSSPAATATAECVKTAGMSAERLTGYLKDLRGGSGAYGSKALTLDASGLTFTPEAVERPCEAVTVKLAHYWVDIEKTREATDVRPASYEYQYTLIKTASHKVGPHNGTVPRTAPPAGTTCRGTVSVAYRGEDIPLKALPYELELVDTTAAVPVEVSGDGVLSAVYIAPGSVEPC
ncbi:hypothetical protein [Streptomyces flavalbus]|uniref:Lipoprotein n=1 Tax=Streptomyces flavalbus TaxID=2665155 RepID=A0ABW2WHX2_9ACTN